MLYNDVQVAPEYKVVNLDQDYCISVINIDIVIFNEQVPNVTSIKSINRMC